MLMQIDCLAARSFIRRQLSASGARELVPRPILTPWILYPGRAEVLKLAEEDSPEARAVRSRLIADDPKEIAERLVAVEERIDALERKDLKI